MSNRNSLVVLLLCIPFFLFGQFSYTNDSPVSPLSPSGHIRCSSMEVDAIRKLNNPAIPDTESFEEWLAPKVKEIKKQWEYHPLKTSSVLQIPVVVHVLHNGEAIGTAPNITDAQVISQIQVLNEDFRRIVGSRGHNSHPDGADVEIEFVLAKSDEDGNPTNGISRRNIEQDGATRDDLENTIKPATIWNPTMFLNMWTVKFAAPDDNLLGYAQFPEGSGLQGMPAGAQSADTDGVVMRATAFGTSDLDDGTFVLNANYDLGRTATHEVGHWVGLRHIWGDMLGCNNPVNPPGCSCSVDDFCADTPNSDEANYSCSEPPTSLCAATPTFDMFENYMDYTNDACMNIFTNDQKARVHAVMTNSPRRMELPTSPGLLEPAPRVSFATNVSSEIELSSCNTRNISIPISIMQAPSSNATVTLSLSGTAILNEDYTISSTTVVFPSGTNADKMIDITLNEDAEVEDNETIILTIVSVSGGGGIPGLLNQTHTFTITNDDYDPLLFGTQPGVTLFEDGFDTGMSGWTTSTFGGSPINWVVGTPIGGIAQSAYVAQTALANTYKYDGLTESFARLESPSIDATFYTDLVLTFDYICMGETGYDLGTLYYSTDDGANWRRLPNEYSDSPMQTTETVTLPAETAGCSTLKIAFRWDNDALVEINPPFNVDNVKIEGAFRVPTEVQGEVNSGNPAEQNLGPNQTIFFYNPSNNYVMVSVKNNSNYDYGCTTVEVDRSKNSAGVNSSPFWNANPANEILPQTFRIIPTNNTPPAGAEYEVTLYYNFTDILAWEMATGQSRNNLEIIKVANNPVSSVNTSNFGNYIIDVKTATTGQYNTSRVTVKGTFTDGFSGFGTGVPGQPSALPIELLDFYGENLGKKIMLKWATEAEIDNDYFTIERSKDGNNFEPIGEISGAGFSNELLTYDFLDSRPFLGKNYYRLRQTDFDGTSTVSNIIVFDIEEVAEVQVFPNPVSEQLTIQLSEGLIEKEVQIGIFDISGKLIQQIDNQNFSQTTIDVSQLIKGIYLLKIESEGASFSKKLVVK